MMAMERRRRLAVPFQCKRLGGSTWPTKKNASPICWDAPALDVWGDMPRDVQEALFETAMKEHDAEREELARLLHDRHPRTLHPGKPG
jgi:hypothetical protein